MLTLRLSVGSVLLVLLLAAPSYGFGKKRLSKYNDISCASYEYIRGVRFARCEIETEVHHRIPGIPDIEDADYNYFVIEAYGRQGAPITLCNSNRDSAASYAHIEKALENAQKDKLCPKN